MSVRPFPRPNRVRGSSLSQAPPTPGKQADLGLWGEGEGLRCPLGWKQWSLGQGMGENWRMPGRDKGLEGLDEHIQTAVV